MAAHQAPPSPGFSRQEYWSRLPFPSPMHESEKWKWSCSVVSNSATPWTAAHQAPPSMEFSRREYWSGVHCLLRHYVPGIFKTIQWFKILISYKFLSEFLHAALCNHPLCSSSMQSHLKLYMSLAYYCNTYGMFQERNQMAKDMAEGLEWENRQTI